MTVFVCIDNSGGMMFAGKRLSRDRAVTADIIKTADGGRLFITDYSSMLFVDGNGTVCENPLNDAGQNDFCFIEDLPLCGYEDKTDKLIVYNWNRDYPSDVKLNIDYKNRFSLVSSEDIAGYSHEKITKEVYIK